MKTRVYNNTHKMLDVLPEVAQDDILNCPEFFAMSLSEILQSGQCPKFLEDILNKFPWSGRHNVIQVKPQDFRVAKPKLLGTGVHSDTSVMLNDGITRVADNLDDFRLITVSFGGIVETQFVATPMELPDLDDPNVNVLKFFQALPDNLKYDSPAPNQIAEYTSLDLHRMGTDFKLGNARLFIVAFECNRPMGGGIILPSIIDRPASKIEFEDYHK